MPEKETPKTLQHSTDIDQEKYQKFLAHNCTERKRERNPKTSTAIGGRISYIYTPNSIGTEISVRCKCGLEEDITNINSW